MRALLILTMVLVVVAAGGVWASADADRAERRPEQARDATGDHRDRDRAAERSGGGRRRTVSPLPAPSCPADVADCRGASGRVLYVESVDPDGDGDLHVVLGTRNGVSGPGITAVDVKPVLRPRGDPRPGDQVSAAGPVQPGSYGQAQVHALEFHLRRR